MLIVLNKIDMLPPDTREAEIKKKTDELRQKFSKTRFGSNIPVIPVSANVGAKEEKHDSENIDLLIKTLLTDLRLPKRTPAGDFFFLIDHCFPIKGQGSVVTGTVISGTVKVGSEVEFPLISEKKKVKSIQMFKKPIEKAMQGDRIGMLFAQLDNKQVKIKKKKINIPV